MATPVAVYLHIRRKKAAFVEFSHDGDFYISLQDFGELRDIEEVTTNRRRGKHQIVKNGIDFDVYVERHNSLLVSHQDVERASVVIDDVRVASVEHLLLLKLDAYRNRRGSGKGEKDERDIIRLGYLLSDGADLGLLAPYLTAEMVDMLRGVERSKQFLVMCQRNAQQASRVREAFCATVDQVAKVPAGGRR